MSGTPEAPGLPPFACVYSPSLPSLLWQLGLSLGISTYQAGKIVFFSALDPSRLIQIARDFPSAMGLCVQGPKLAVASFEEVGIFANSPELAATYPPKPGTYDALFLPRATFHSGQMNVHDMAWGNMGLWVVNTRMSCLALVDSDYNFRPMWMPPFVSELDPNDRCHLNGMAMAAGEPAYATAFCPADEPRGWRKFDSTKVGLLIHVPSGKPVLEGLCRPHSPRVHRGLLYVCNSGAGEVLRVDPESKTFEVIARLPGWTRGMAFFGDFLFVGLSMMREGRGEGARDFPLTEAGVATRCGLAVIDLRNLQVVADMRYDSSVEQVYDIAVLPGIRRPNILNTASQEHKLALHLPGETFWGRETGAKEAKMDLQARDSGL